MNHKSPESDAILLLAMPFVCAKSAKIISLEQLMQSVDKASTAFAPEVKRDAVQTTNTKVFRPLNFSLPETSRSWHCRRNAFCMLSISVNWYTR